MALIAQTDGILYIIHVCTLALYFNIFDRYPIVVAANRDEHYDRPSAGPQVICQKPTILAGRDLVAGGTWLGVNEHGLIVGILNRRTNEEQKAANFRSRGLLCLDLLGLESATQSAYLLEQQAAVYQPFTVVFADRTGAWTASNFGRHIQTTKLNTNLHVFSNTGTDAGRSEKHSRAYALFDDVVSRPAGKTADLVLSFAGVLSDHHLGNDSSDPKDAICVHGDISGTVSSTVLVYSPIEKQFQTYYCPGAPCRHSFSERPPITVL
jgi:uncharacterized protein with NRDE domain